MIATAWEVYHQGSSSSILEQDLAACTGPPRRRKRVHNLVEGRPSEGTGARRSSGGFKYARSRLWRVERQRGVISGRRGVFFRVFFWGSENPPTASTSSVEHSWRGFATVEGARCVEFASRQIVGSVHPKHQPPSPGARRCRPTAGRAVSLTRNAPRQEDTG